jgi:hypothetical protein
MVPAVAAEPDDVPALFQNDREAQAHCPQDVVVWLNLASGYYHYRGMQWYGRTQSGAYICKKEADRIGAQRTKLKE